MTKQTILLAAAHIFRDKGFHAASMQDIADAVQLRKASLYHHFSSKQEILEELLDQAMDMVIESVSDILGQPLDPTEKLHRAAVTYLETITEFPDLASVLILEFRFLEEKYQALHIPRRDEFERLWGAILQEGINKGKFNRVDVSLSVKGILGALNWAITWYRVDGPMKAGEIGSQIIRLFLDGLILESIPHE